MPLITFIYMYMCIGDVCVHKYWQTLFLSFAVLCILYVRCGIQVGMHECVEWIGCFSTRKPLKQLSILFWPMVRFMFFLTRSPYKIPLGWSIILSKVFWFGLGDVILFIYTLVVFLCLTIS